MILTILGYGFPIEKHCQQTNAYYIGISRNENKVNLTKLFISETNAVNTLPERVNVAIDLRDLSQDDFDLLIQNGQNEIMNWGIKPKLITGSC